MGRPIDNCGNNIIFLIKEVLDILDYKSKVLSYANLIKNSSKHFKEGTSWMATTVNKILMVCWSYNKNELIWIKLKDPINSRLLSKIFHENVRLI